MSTYGPPFDGVPCPMCPIEVRNLSATVHNLAWRLIEFQKTGESACKIRGKFHSMQQAVKGLSLDASAPKELKQLYKAAAKAANSETVGELLKCADSLKHASDQVSSLSEAHFSNRRHSHGC